MEVQAARDVDGKGRHTTTTRNLLALPGGGVLIDTPGLRGVGLWDAEVGVGQVFSEIEELSARCRFHDCAHESEPGCAVRSAVDAGELPVRRLESYRKLMRENQWIVAKTDARLRAEIKKDWKRKGRRGAPRWRRSGGGGSDAYGGASAAGGRLRARCGRSRSSPRPGRDAAVPLPPGGGAVPCPISASSASSSGGDWTA